MNGIFRVIGNLLAGVFADMLTELSPVIRDEIEKLCLMLHDKALKTKNPVDDMFTGLLLRLFGFEVPKK